MYMTCSNLAFHAYRSLSGEQLLNMAGGPLKVCGLVVVPDRVVSHLRSSI